MMLDFFQSSEFTKIALIIILTGIVIFIIAYFIIKKIF